jgi:hypothetical protein
MVLGQANLVAIEEAPGFRDCSSDPVWGQLLIEEVAATDDTNSLR